MPPSRYVSSHRLLRMTVFFPAAVVLLTVLALGLGVMGASASTRRVLVLTWLVALPVGGWWVWKAGREGSSRH